MNEQKIENEPNCSRIILRVIRMDVERRRRKGRPKWMWMDSVNVDFREKRLSGEETQDRAVWRQLVSCIDPT